MKKIIALLLSVVQVFTLGACAPQTQQASGDGVSSAEVTELDMNTAGEKPKTTDKNDGKVLIVYYSYSGVTKGVSEMLQEKTGGDLFELLPVESYPDDMYETSDRAEEELESANLPELTGEIPVLDEYDTVLVGGPVWSEKAAPPVLSYLTQNDFSGKAVAPFWTYNSNEGDYEKDVTSYIQNAEILDSLGLAHASSMEEDEMNQALGQWLSEILGGTTVNTDTNETQITLTIDGKK